MPSKKKGKKRKERKKRKKRKRKKKKRKRGVAVIVRIGRSWMYTGLARGYVRAYPPFEGREVTPPHILKVHHLRPLVE
jgi:hypothetical protein